MPLNTKVIRRNLEQDGQLNLISIPDVYSEIDEIKTYCYDGLPSCRAITRQSESEDSVSITWATKKIVVLEEKDDFTYVEHVASGKKLWICTDHVYGNQGSCDDSTDYMLPVEAGDLLSIVKPTSRGYLAKKNGVTGWYYGEIEPI